MTTIMPHSELLKRAVVYINDARRDSPEKRLSSVLDEAAMRFNLSPLDCQALDRIFRPESKDDPVK